MLIQFTVGNYKSFKDRVTISMVSTKLKEHSRTHTFKATDTHKLLKSAYIYGANASGKSNLLKAIYFMNSFVVNSFLKAQALGSITVDYFKLNDSGVHSPSYFEVIFLHNNIQYRYGFEITAQRVTSEWLFYTPRKREIKLFTRANKFTIGKDFSEGKKFITNTRDNALFLSTVAHLNGKISQSILQWFHNLLVVYDLNDYTADKISNRLLSIQEFKKELLYYFKNLDLGFENIEIEKKPLYFPEDMAPEVIKYITSKYTDNEKERSVFMITHKKYDKNNKVIGYEKFDLDYEESLGTKKFFYFFSFLLFVLKTGGVLFVDEFDTSLHPLLSKFIINIVNSTKCNKNKAQIIFTTHNQLLLTNSLLRRDQVWFTEKNKYGASSLYPLSEINIRNDATYSKDYLQGKYGAIPIINEELLI